MVGGKTDRYAAYDTRFTDRLGDVWYSDNGDEWTQVQRLRGDFEVQEAAAPQSSTVAPWFARFGHTLTAMDIDNDGEARADLRAFKFFPACPPSLDFTLLELCSLLVGFSSYFVVVPSPCPAPAPFIPSPPLSLYPCLSLHLRFQDDAMVLMGGFAPDPMHDVWMTVDGKECPLCRAPATAVQECQLGKRCEQVRLAVRNFQAEIPASLPLLCWSLPRLTTHRFSKRLGLTFGRCMHDEFRRLNSPALVLRA